MEEQCLECKTWWVYCPCCGVSFCPSCGQLEEDANYEEE